MRHTTGTTLCNHGSFSMERRSLSQIDAARRLQCRTVRHQRVTMKELLGQMTVDGVRILAPAAVLDDLHIA